MIDSVDKLDLSSSKETIEFEKGGHSSNKRRERGYSTTINYFSDDLKVYLVESHMYKRVIEWIFKITIVVNLLLNSDWVIFKLK